MVTHTAFKGVIWEKEAVQARCIVPQRKVRPGCHPFLNAFDHWVLQETAKEAAGVQAEGEAGSGETK